MLHCSALSSPRAAEQVHYVNDADRGVVWEEVIILLPPEARMLQTAAEIIASPIS